MDFNEYQEKAKETAIYPSERLLLIMTGLHGEGGEIAEKIKKIYRDKSGIVSPADKADLTKEMGDVLWYLSELARFLDVDLQDVAEANISKLSSRKDRDKLQGKGDNR